LELFANFQTIILFCSLINGNLSSSLLTVTAIPPQDLNRIIEMAWEDRTPFEAIKAQFGVSETEVIALMRRELKRSSFNLWRKRVNSGVSQKHARKRNPDVSRFKCSRQTAISMNKISKR
jgi:uncharacterized protein (TIGR03643 family)